MVSSRLRSYRRALVRAMAACWARMPSSSSSWAVKPQPPSGAGLRLLARNRAAMVSSPSRTGRPRKSDMSGWVEGQPSKRGSSRTSARRSGFSLWSIAARMPCWRGSGPMARHCSSLTPSTTNWAKPPWSSGTPRAAYSASRSSRAETTIVLRTSRTSSCLLISSRAVLTAARPERGRSVMRSRYPRGVTVRIRLWTAEDASQVLGPRRPCGGPWSRPRAGHGRALHRVHCGGNAW